MNRDYSAIYFFNQFAYDIIDECLAKSGFYCYFVGLKNMSLLSNDVIF